MGRDYIFFTSYIQPPVKEGAGLWSNTEELGTANGMKPSGPFWEVK